MSPFPTISVVITGCRPDTAVRARTAPSAGVQRCAVSETPEHEVKVYLSPDNGRPLLEVWDSSARPPYLRAEDPLGRKRPRPRIVKALSADCGYRILTNGKTIWARLK